MPADNGRARSRHLDRVLAEAQSTLPYCVSLSAIDLRTRQVLSSRTDAGRDRSSLEPVAAATGELFTGQNTVGIQSMLDRIGGGPAESESFQEIVIFSEGFLHCFQRCRDHSDVVMLTICRKNANMGMVMTKGRIVLEALDRALESQSADHEGEINR